MNKKKALVVGGFAVLAVALCATASSLVWVCRKVRAFESSHGGSVYANLSKAERDEKVRSEIAAAADMNGDGINDVVTLGGSEAAPVISVYLGTGGGTLCQNPETDAYALMRPVPLARLSHRRAQGRPERRFKLGPYERKSSQNGKMICVQPEGIIQDIVMPPYTFSGLSGLGKR